MMNTAAILGALMTVTTSTGSVAPQYGHTTTCRIGQVSTIIDTTGRLIDFPHQIQKRTQFTQAVPNVSVLLNMVNEAYGFESKHFPSPIGAGIETYVARIPGVASIQVVLKALAGNQTTEYNTSPVTNALIDFANLNCK